MVAYIIKRLISSFMTVIIITFISFFFVALLPGEPAELLLGEFATPEKVAVINRQWGLDKPILVRYTIWLKNLLHGNFGNSILSRKPTLELLLNAWPVTFELCVLAITVACLIGIPAGIFAATWRPTGQRLLLVSILVGQSIPSFVSGLILILIVCINWRLLPASGYVGFFHNPLKNLQAMLLPSISLGLVLSASLARFTRGCMLDVLHEDFIRTARSKGLKERLVILKHGLRSAIIPVVSLLGTQIVWFLGGAIIQEIIFILPGMGRLVVRSVMNRDYSVIQGVVLIMAVTAAVANLVVDLMYGFLDPRIRYE